MALAAKIHDLTESLIAGYSAPEGEAKWAQDARARALAGLRENGAPVRRDEYWKFTNPVTLTDPQAPKAAVFKSTDTEVFYATEKLTLVFIDGEFRAEMSDDLEHEGVSVEKLSDAMAQDIHWASDIYGKLESKGQTPVSRPMAALNSAMARDGFCIHVTGKVSKPVAFCYQRESETADAMVHHVLKMDAGSDLTLLENGPGAARFNTVMEIDMAENASLHHIRVQGRDHERRAATHMFARLSRESSFKSFTLTVNGVLTRNEAVLEFTGDDAHARVAGACAGDGDFHHDDTVFITHDAVNCESRQVFKKVLRNGATGVFQGKILVQPGAQKTDGYQTSQGLLLDDDCNFLAKPELEIYADDVACSHGSTCGAVDETALFYLTSRGIKRDDAQDMLVLAFMDEAIQEIEDQTLADDLRDHLNGWLARRKG